MKLSNAIPLLVGLCLIGVLARPMMEYGDQRAAANAQPPASAVTARRNEMTGLLTRLEASPLPDAAERAETLRVSLGESVPTEDQVTQVRELVATAEAAGAAKAPSEAAASQTPKASP